MWRRRRLELGVEEGGIGFETGRIIALGIRRYKNHLSGRRQLLQLIVDGAYIGQRGGADIGTEGVTDEEKGPVAQQVGWGEWLVVGIDQLEVVDVPPDRIVVSMLRPFWLGEVEGKDQAACQQQKQQGIAKLHHNKRPFRFSTHSIDSQTGGGLYPSRT